MSVDKVWKEMHGRRTSRRIPEGKLKSTKAPIQPMVGRITVKGTVDDIHKAIRILQRKDSPIEVVDYAISIR